MLRLSCFAIPLSLSLSVAFAGLACSSSSDTGSTPPVVDSGTQQTTVDAGSTATVCIPSEGAPGNSKHVGAYCRANEGQCSKFGGNTYCATDLDPRGNNFCILLNCTTHADCGEGACCTGDPGNSVHACVPAACVADAGVCPAIP